MSEKKAKIIKLNIPKENNVNRPFRVTDTSSISEKVFGKLPPELRRKKRCKPFMEEDGE